MIQPITPDSTALITGASSGLGAEFARQLAAQGVHLVLTARRADRLDVLANELTARHGVRVLTLPMDLTEAGAAQRLFEATEGSNLRIDILINNAGFGTQQAFTSIDWARTQQMLALNVLATTELTTRFVGAMHARRRGHILHVASIQSFMSAPGYATYAASKAYLRHFSEALSHELRPSGVSVTCTCPGGTETEFLGVAGHDMPALVRKFVGPPAPVVASSLRALARGQTTVIPGFINRLIVLLLRMMPRSLHLHTVHKLISGL